MYISACLCEVGVESGDESGDKSAKKFMISE